MLRSQSKCTQNVIGGYIGKKMIRSPQFTQDVPTGFQVTSPPVVAGGWTTWLALAVLMLQRVFHEFRELQEEILAEHMVDALVADIEEIGGSE